MRTSDDGWRPYPSDPDQHRRIRGRRAKFSRRRKRLPAHCRLRLPVRLRDHVPDRPERRGRVDVRPPPGLAVRLQRPPRPQRRQLSPRPLRRDGPRGPALPARQPDGGDHLADPHRLADRPRRPVHGAVAQRRRALQDPPPFADRLRRRALPAAHRQMRERVGRPVHDAATRCSTTAASSPTGPTRATATATWWPATGDGYRLKLRITTDLRPGIERRGLIARTRLVEGDDALRGPVVVAAAARRTPWTRPPSACTAPPSTGGSGSPRATSPTTAGAATCSAAPSPSRA